MHEYLIPRIFGESTNTECYLNYMSMGVIVEGDGVGRAVVKAINAVVDIVLIAYDPDFYFEAMSAVLQAGREGRIDKEKLRESQGRLKEIG